MSEFEDLLNSVGEVKPRDVVKGEILSVGSDQATVSIVGTGIEGVLTLREITNERDADINEFVKSGDILDLLVLKQIVGKESEGANVYLLSLKRLAARKTWEELEGKEGDVVIVKVTRAVKGGLSVSYNGVRGFIPASLIDTHFVRDTKRFEGQEIEAKIVELNVSEGRLVLNRRAVIEEERVETLREAMAQLNEGDIVEGTIARVTNFGAFVDLGGVDGLVHITELNHGRLRNPADIVEVGQKVNVKILGLDPDKGRISLSLKATTPGPWDGIEQKIAKGDELEGVVKRVTDFGAFVELFPNIEGLVHVSQISWDHVEKPSDKIKAGDKVQVKVLDVKPDEERISLSIKALEERPASAGAKENEENNRPARKPRAKRAVTQKVALPENESGFTLAEAFGDINLDDLVKKD